MKDFKFTNQIDYPFDANTFDEMQKDYKLFEKMLVTMVGNNNVIIYGCTINGATIDSGLMLINGELVQFTGGIKYATTFIKVNMVTSTVVESGTNYTINTEKVASTNDTTGVLYSSFKTMGKARFDAEEELKTFVPFINQPTGISVQYSKCIVGLHDLRIRVNFVVDINALTNSNAFIYIHNWANGNYGSENIDRVVGTYSLMHLDSSMEKLQSMGYCFVNGSGELMLVKPFTESRDLFGIQAAKFSDLIESGNPYTKYRVQIEARITTN